MDGLQKNAKICSSLSLQFWFAANSKSGKMLVCGQFRVYRGVPENFVGFLYMCVCVVVVIYQLGSLLLLCCYHYVYYNHNIYIY